MELLHLKRRFYEARLTAYEAALRAMKRTFSAMERSLDRLHFITPRPAGRCVPSCSFYANMNNCKTFSQSPFFLKICAVDLIYALCSFTAVL